MPRRRPERPLLDALALLRARVNHLRDDRAAELCDALEEEVQRWAEDVARDVEACERRLTACPARAPSRRALR